MALHTTCTRLFVNAIKKPDIPRLTILPTLFQEILIALFFRFRIAFFPVRKRKTQMAEQSWEMIVAKAAPWTPMCIPKINRGSRRMFSTAPISIVSIPVFPKPWLLINGFIPRVIITNRVPRR